MPHTPRRYCWLVMVVIAGCLPHASIAQQSQEELMALQEIDALAAHPDDPQNEPTVVGVTDGDILAISAEEVAAVIERTHLYATNHPNPRYIFALGRAAWLQGDTEYGRELLTNAAQRGSAAAAGYLGKLETDPQQQIFWFEQAIRGGFKPAQQWLEAAKMAMTWGGS